MRFVITDNKRVGDWAAVYVANKIREFNPTAEKKFVLGLPTGSTPLQMYKRLIEFNKAGIISFKNVVTFNMDEYLGLEATHDQSYHYFMRENLFRHINIRPENTHVPSGEAKDVEKSAAEYDDRLYELGGVDLQVLGIGNNGHIGFNEPADVFAKGTGLVDLTASTIEANSRFFASIDDVPKKAVSMGIATIMQAKQIMLLASGQGKAGIIAQTILGEITPQVPASALQLHRNVTFFLDEAAAAELLAGLGK